VSDVFYCCTPPGGVAGRPDVLVSFGRSDTALYGPLRTWMAASDLPSNALHAGAEAPDFFLPDERARLISLSSLLVKGPVVLIFMPGSWCSFSINKIRALSAALRGRAVSVVTLTPETAAYPRDMKAQNELDCVVLADVDYGVGLSFGLTFMPPPGIVAEMKAYGLDLREIHGASTPMLPAPAIYVIGPSGKITMAQVDLDYMTSIEPEKIRQALDAAS
jgi:peroxiredoxin